MPEAADPNPQVLVGRSPRNVGLDGEHGKGASKRQPSLIHGLAGKSGCHFSHSAFRGPFGGPAVQRHRHRWCFYSYRFRLACLALMPIVVSLVPIALFPIIHSHILWVAMPAQLCPYTVHVVMYICLITFFYHAFSRCVEQIKSESLVC